MSNADIEKILDMLVWFYCHAKLTVVWRKAKGEYPIPLNLLTNEEKAFVIEHSLLNSLLN